MPPAVITVCLPVFNGGPFLLPAVQSIVEQTHKDWRLLVVDDGSTDGSVDRLHATFGADPRIRILRQPHRGVVAAANTALLEADTPWVARMDADDLARPQRLEAQLAYALAHPEVDVVTGQVQSVRRDGALGGGFARYDAWQNALVTHEDMAREAFVEMPAAHPTWMMRRERILELGGYRDGAFPEDYELFLRALGAGLRFGKVPEVVLEWHDHPGRATRRDPRYSKEAFLEVKAEYLSALLSARRVLVWGGRTARRLGRMLSARGVKVEAWVDIDPRKRGQCAEGRPFLSPDDLPPPGTFYVVACVGTPGAREEIRGALVARGYQEIRDFRLAG